MLSWVNQELPELQCVNVVVDGEVDRINWSSVASVMCDNAVRTSEVCVRASFSDAAATAPSHGSWEVERLVRVTTAIAPTPRHAQTAACGRCSDRGTAVVTGAFGGIGRQLVTRLIAGGCYSHVVVMGRNASLTSAQRAWKCSDGGCVDGVTLVPFPCDVSDLDAVLSVPTYAAAQGCADIVAVFHVAGTWSVSL